MKKSLSHILIVLKLSILAGCSQMELSLSPVSSITDGNFWKSTEQWESFIIGIHGRLRTHTYNLFVLGGMRGDEFGDTSFGGESTYNISRTWLNTLNANDPIIENYGGIYSNINQINLLIERTESADILSSSEKEYYLGQGYGLRAFYYFHLLRSWGDVILHLEPTTTFDLKALSKGASPASEIMAQIKSDIAKSEVGFGNNYTLKQNKSLWSKSATLMLKAEVLLWAARQMGGGSADVSAAKAALTEIQSNVPSFGLMDSYKDIFATTSKGNKEIIFAIRNDLLEYELMGGSFLLFLPQINYIGSYYDTLSRARIDVKRDLVGGTGGFQAPIKKSTYWAFSDEDSRKWASIKGAFRLEGETLTLAGCYVNKYQGILNAGNRVMVDDYPIYRYADLLLMLAEAKSLLGEDPAQEINLVRKRAFGGNYTVEKYGFPNKSGDNNVNEAILAERFYEFISEGKRWYDLRRFGKEYVLKYTTLHDENRMLWPIDITTLTNNKSLTQTPGY